MKDQWIIEIKYKKSKQTILKIIPNEAMALTKYDELKAKGDLQYIELYKKTIIKQEEL